MPQTPDLSVVIPAWNEEDYLSDLLDSLQSQKFDDYETIVVDNNSTDNTRSVAKNYDVKLVQETKQGPGYARNCGAEHASGDVLLFLDADVRLRNKHTFSKVVSILSDTEIVAGSGTWVPNDGNWVHKQITKISSKLISFLFKWQIITVASGAFLFIEAETFDKLNGFRGELPFNEDHDIIQRANNTGKIELLENICSISTRRLQVRGIFGTSVDYGIPTALYLFGHTSELKSREFNAPRPTMKKPGSK